MSAEQPTGQDEEWDLPSEVEEQLELLDVGDQRG